jgi:hypothetical protein
MEVVILQTNGRRKKVIRTLTVRCLACKIKIPCPADGDFWGWLKSEEVKSFYATHLQHASPSQVGADMRMEESDDY